MGMVTSAFLVAGLTLWATSSPFSPLGMRQQRVADSPGYYSVRKATEAPRSMIQGYELSESILPAQDIAAVAYEAATGTDGVLSLKVRSRTDQQSDLQFESLSTPNNLQTHAQRQDDRLAWQTYRRQDALLASKPIEVIQTRTTAAVNVADLSEVHFTNRKYSSVPERVSNLELLKSSRIPHRERGLSRQESAPDQQPVRTAILPIQRRYVAPYGNQNVTNLPVQAMPLQQKNSQQKSSWQTGQY